MLKHYPVPGDESSAVSKVSKAAGKKPRGPKASAGPAGPRTPVVTLVAPDGDVLEDVIVFTCLNLNGKTPEEIARLFKKPVGDVHRAFGRVALLLGNDRTARLTASIKAFGADE